MIRYRDGYKYQLAENYEIQTPSPCELLKWCAANLQPWTKE